MLIGQQRAPQSDEKCKTLINKTHSFHTWNRVEMSHQFSVDLWNQVQSSHWVLSLILISYKICNPMEQSTSWVSIFSQGFNIFPHFLQTNVHYHVHTSTPLGPVLSQINPTHYSSNAGRLPQHKCFDLVRYFFRVPPCPLTPKIFLFALGEITLPSRDTHVGQTPSFTGVGRNRRYR